MTARSLLISCSNRSEYGLLRPILTRLARGGGAGAEIQHTLLLFSEAAESCQVDAERDHAGRRGMVEVMAQTSRRTGESVGDHFARLVAGFDALERFDAVLLPGDRYETFALASRCFFGHVPIFHLFGGDISNGGHFDDHLRHAVSHLASVHFPVNRAARANLLAMHQEPTRVFHVGSPVVDEIADIMASASPPQTWSVVLSFNPMTLGPPEAVGEALAATLEALTRVARRRQFACVATRPNREPGADDIDRVLERHADRAWLEVRDSLGSPTYLHAIRTADLVIGNSSSQLLEVPVLGTRSLLVGDRQKGRYAPDSVVLLRGRPTADAIEAAIDHLLASPRPAPAVDYGTAGVSDRIIQIMARALACPRAQLVEKSLPLHLMENQSG